jgi:hypothetical protein
MLSAVTRFTRLLDSIHAVFIIYTDVAHDIY